VVLVRLRLAVRGRRFWFVCLCGGRMIMRMRHWYWGSDKHGLSRMTVKGQGGKQFCWGRTFRADSKERESTWLLRPGTHFLLRNGPWSCGRQGESLQLQHRGMEEQRRVFPFCLPEYCLF